MSVLTSTIDKALEAHALRSHYVIDSNDKVQLRAVTSTFDLMLSTVNVSLHWPNFLAMFKPKGRLHFLGLVMEPLNIAVAHFMAGQKTISSSSVGSPSSIAKMLTFAEQHNIGAKVEVFPLSRVNEAIAHLREDKARYRVVLTPG